MKQPVWFWPLVILISTGASWLFYASGNEGGVRAAVLLWFLFVCPGLAVVGLLGIAEPITKWTIVIALSIALDLVVTVTMLYANLWSIPAGLALLGLFAASGAIAQLSTGQS
jgi:hypothetical protein